MKSTVFIDKDLHNKLKVLCAIRRVKIGEFVEKAVELAIRREEKKAA